MPTPLQMLGLRGDFSPDNAIKRYEDDLRIQQMPNLFDDSGMEGCSLRGLAVSVVMNANLVVDTFYLQGRWQKCIEWCRKLGEATDNALQGDWRQKDRHEDGRVDPDAWFEKSPCLPWGIYFSDGLAWSAIGQHWQLVDRLLAFPTEKTVPDRQGRAARNYYVGLARWWKDPMDLAWISSVKGARGAGSKGYHLLCSAMEAISKSDPKATATALQKYVEWFLKQRLHEEQFPLNASFLWQVARRQRMTLAVPEEIDRFLFRIPEESMR